MKVVINKCYGGFSLSPLGIKKMAELKGKQCFFFTQNIEQGLDGPRIPTKLGDVANNLMFSAFSIPNPDEVLKSEKNWHEMTSEERGIANRLYESVTLSCRDYDRNDPDLVKCVEKLGKKANGRCAKLAIIEIPDGIEFEVEEYDGFEHIAEKHRTWGG